MGGSPDKIAALVRATQERRSEIVMSPEKIYEGTSPDIPSSPCCFGNQRLKIFGVIVLHPAETADGFWALIREICLQPPEVAVFLFPGQFLRSPVRVLVDHLRRPVPPRVIGHLYFGQDEGPVQRVVVKKEALVSPPEINICLLNPAVGGIVQSPVGCILLSIQVGHEYQRERNLGHLAIEGVGGTEQLRISVLFGGGKHNFPYWNLQPAWDFGGHTAVSSDSCVHLFQLDNCCGNILTSHVNVSMSVTVWLIKQPHRAIEVIRQARKLDHVPSRDLLCQNAFFVSVGQFLLCGASLTILRHVVLAELPKKVEYSHWNYTSL